MERAPPHRRRARARRPRRLGRRSGPSALAGFGYAPRRLAARASSPVRPDIPFAPLEDTALKDPDNPTKIFRVDLARVEHDFPLTRAERAALTPGQHPRAEPGGGRPALRPPHRRPDPRRPLPRRSLLRRAATACGRALEEILGGLRGPHRRREDRDVAEAAGRALWKGKMFYRDERELRNFIEDFRAARRPDRRSRRAARRPPCRARAGSSTSCPPTDVWLLFPAKLYCGQSLARRPARVGHHRLRLQRRDARLPGEPRRAGRPQRPAHPRRDPHDPAGLLSGPRLRQQGLPAELHAL